MSDFLLQLKAAKTDEEREWLVMRFSLDSLDPAVRAAVWAAAIPRWFDRDFMAGLLERSLDEEFGRIFEKLISLSFVEAFQGRGHNIHERSRNLLLKHLWDDDRARYRELNKRAADYCARQDASDAEWRVASLYHLLLADENSGVDEFINQGIDWENQFQYGFLEGLARSVMTEFEAKRMNKRAAAWAYHFQASSDLRYSRNDASMKNLALALSTYAEDVHLKRDSLKSLGSLYFLVDRYDEAREKLAEAHELYRQSGDQLGEANCLYWLGEVYRFTNQKDKAQQSQEQALQLYRQGNNKLGESTSLWALGELHKTSGEHQAAQQEFTEALQMCRQITNHLGEVNCIVSLGDVSYIQGEHDEARKKYNEALSLSRQINYRNGEANSIAALGRLHLSLEEYDKAKAMTEEALQIYNEIGDKLNEEKCLSRLDKLKEHLKGRQSTS